jgi:SAM-dependent methyltransferase
MATIDGLDMSYRVAQCKSCGLIYADQLPSQATYSKYYHELSKYDIIASLDDVGAVHQSRATATIELCKDYLSSDSIIADLGCGSGYLLWRFMNAGYHQLYGLDPGRESANRARDLFSLKGVQQGLLRDVGSLLPLHELDLVCLAGVLEHLWTPREDMQHLISGLRKNTLIMIEVPGLERFDSEGDEPYGEFSIEHIQYFSRATLSSFMRSVGTKPLFVDYLSMPEGLSQTSLFGLFRVDNSISIPNSADPSDLELVSHYIATSQTRLKNALLRIPKEDIIVYGAGSHTARMLPAMNLDLVNRIHCVFDANVNLHSKRIDRFEIRPPIDITLFPGLPIVISSFRAQSIIANSLSGWVSNPLVLLY